MQRRKDLKYIVDDILGKTYEYFFHCAFASCVFALILFYQVVDFEEVETGPEVGFQVDAEVFADFDALGAE